MNMGEVFQEELTTFWGPQDFSTWNATIGFQLPSTSLIIFILFGVIYLIIGCLIVLSNVLNIWAILFNKVLHRSVTNHMLLSLSFADLLMAVSIFISALQHFGIMAVSEIGMKFELLYSRMPVSIALTMSTYSVILVGFDRYLAVAKPFHYKRLVTLKNARVFIIIGWVVFSSFYIISFVYYIFIVDTEHLGREVLLQELFPPLYYTVAVVGFAYLQAAVVVVLYLVVIITTFKNTKQVGALCESGDDKWIKSRKKALKVTKLALITVCVLVLCGLPYSIMSMMPSYNIVTSMFLICILWSSSFLNPLIYAWRLKEFRDAFKGILLCQKQTGTQRRGSSEAQQSVTGPKIIKVAAK